MAPPLTIPLGHQTSTSTLLLLPQVRCLVGEYPEEFLFQVENCRHPSAAGQAMAASPTQPAHDTAVIDEAVADRYLDKFLTLVHPFHPFFDRHDLVARYDDVMSRGLGFDTLSAMFLAIFALGATASDPIDTREAGHSGDAFIQKASRILFASWAVSFGGDILISQGLVLCALYFTYKAEPLVAWRLIHMASTNIQQMLARSANFIFILLFRCPPSHLLSVQAPSLFFCRR